MGLLKSDANFLWDWESQLLDYLSATIYGVVQGLAEFLPISSSGHLALLPIFLRIKDPGVAFDLAMHVGTALAVIIYFRSDVWKLLTATGRLLVSRKRNEQSYFALNLLMATITTVVVALMVKGVAATWGRGVEVISLNLLLFAILMSVADYFAPKKELTGKLWMEKRMMWKQSVLIGLFQGMAIFPGVSRSGATLTISRFLGLTRKEATRFSFLLSLPIILGGFLSKLSELTADGASYDPVIILWGVVVSLVVGLITIIFFLRFIERIGLIPFAIYRVVIALLIFWFIVKFI